MSSSRTAAELGAVAPVLLWCAVLLRWRTFTGDPYQRLLSATLVVAAVVATLEADAVAGLATRQFGTAGTLGLALGEHLLVLLLAAMAIELVGLIGRTDPVGRGGLRRRIAVATAVGVLLVATGVAAGRRTGGDLRIPGAVLSPLLAVHSALFIGYLGFALTLVVARAAWFRTHVPAAPARTSLTLIGCGSAVGLVFVAHKLVLLALLALAPRAGFVRSAHLVETSLIGVSFVLIAVGCAVPTLVRTRLRVGPALVTLAELDGLWRRLGPVVRGPGAPRPAADRVVGVWRDPEASVYRKVIQIRDAELAVRPYAPPVEREVIAASARRAGVDPFAPGLLDAVELELACRSARFGGLALPTSRALVEGGSDVRAEVAHVRSIARAGRSARLVADRMQKELNL